MTTHTSSDSTASTARVPTAATGSVAGNSDRTHSPDADGVSTWSLFLTSSNTLRIRWLRVQVAPASEVFAVGSKSTVRSRSPARNRSASVASSEPAA